MNKSSRVHRLGSLKRGLFIAAGTICLGLGVVGIILPVLPTTPFLLLSAACYVRGSERMYRWLLNNKWFGKYIRNYREGKGIPLRGKVSALLLLWIAISCSALLLVKITIVQIILFAIAFGVSMYIIRLPTFRKS